jgi:hypothetical protein
MNKEQKALWNKEWIKNNRDRYNASKYIYRERCKIDVLKHYSGGEPKCKICGIMDVDVLCLDHIENDGAEHRKSAGISGRGTTGMNTYEVIKRDGLPKGIQVLCANCNLKKEINRKREHRLENRLYVYRKEGGAKYVRCNNTISV